MPTTVEARLALNLSNFKQGLEEAQQALASSTGRMTAAQKKAAAEAEKELKKATAAEAKHARERESAAQRFKGEAQGMAGELVNATSASDLLAGSVTRIADGLNLGVVGGVAVTVLSGIIGKVTEAVSVAESFRATMNDALKPRGGAGGFTMGELQGNLDKSVAAGAAIKERGEHPIKTFVQDDLADSWNKVTSDLGLTDRVTPHTAGDDSGARAAVGKAAQEDVDRMTQKMKDLAEVERVRVTQGERAAALQKIEMERLEKTNAARRLANEVQAKTGLNVSTVDMATQINSEAEAQKAQVNRQFAEGERTLADETFSAMQRADAAVTSHTSKVEALTMEIERLHAEEAKQRSYASELPENDERRMKHMTAAKLLEQQGIELSAQKGVVQRDIDKANLDSLAAREQAQIAALTVTSRELAAKQQMELLEKQIAANSARRVNADEMGKAAIDQQNTALKAQITSLGLVQRDVDKVNAETAFAREQVQVNLLATVNHELAAKQQIDLLERQILANAERRVTVDEMGRAAIDQQNTSLKAQITSLQQARALMTPAEKRNEKRKDGHDARRIHAKTTPARGRHDADRGKADTAKNKARMAAENAERAKPSGDFLKEAKRRNNMRDRMIRGFDRPAMMESLDVTRLAAAFDKTSLAQDMRKLALQPARAA